LLVAQAVVVTKPHLAAVVGKAAVAVRVVIEQPTVLALVHLLQ
jgi:hypothetical protein